MSAGRSDLSTPAPLPVAGRWAEAIGRVARGREADRLRQIIRPRPELRLLDVGGRTGAFTLRIAYPIRSIVVLEPDPGAVRKGERRHPDFRFVVGRGEQIPFPDGSFDRVVAIRSTHHMETPGRFFGEAYRVLSEGGSLVIEELPPTSGWARLFRAMAGHSHHGMTFQGPAAWESALRTAGFDRVEVRPQPPWFFVTGSKPASIRPGAPA